MTSSTTMTPQLSSTSSEQPAEAPAASNSSSSRPLINRPSNPIISMEEDESNDYKLIRLSQSSDDDDDQIIESSLDNKQNQQQQELKQPSSSSSSTTHKTTIDGPKVNFTASTKTGTGPTPPSRSSLDLAKKGNGYLASQTDLTQTSPEKFAMGCTLLQLCAIGNLPTVINYITQTYPHVNFRDYDRRTALHVAASEGHLDVVKLLIARGAKINRSDRWGGSPLDDAHRHRHLVVARYLRSKGATTGSVNLTNNLISAAAAGDIEEVRLIVESNDNVVVVGMDMSGSQSSSKRGHGRSHSSVTAVKERKDLFHKILFPEMLNMENNPPMTPLNLRVIRSSQLTYYNRTLNQEQESAVVGILQSMARPAPYLIYGPPVSNNGDGAFIH